MKSLALTTGAINLGPGAGKTPFTEGRNVSVINMTGAGIAITQSFDNVTYTALATVPTLGVVDVTLPRYIKAASAGLFALGDN